MHVIQSNIVVVFGNTVIQTRFEVNFYGFEDCLATQQEFLKDGPTAAPGRA